MARLLGTQLYEKMLSEQARRDSEEHSSFPEGVRPKRVVTPGSRARSVKEMVEATAGSPDLDIQLRHELIKNRFGYAGAKPLREIAVMLGQTLQEFAEDKLIFDLEMELLFGNSIEMDLSGRNMFSAGGAIDNYGNGGGYPSTTGNPSGGGRSNGPRR
jgi:hypothetical protein